MADRPAASCFEGAGARERAGVTSMASRPKEQRLKALLEQMADSELGEGAGGFDLVCARIAGGQTVTSLALELEQAMGESASRKWISFVINRWGTDAKERLTEARRQAATAYADEAVDIADNAPTKSTADIQKARLRVDTRLNLAKAFDRATFGERPPAAQISIGQLHLAALEEYAKLPACVGAVTPLDVELLPRFDDEMLR
jgi:hypothetical protein